MFQPIAGGDMTPPCVGYRDSKGDWNRLAEITWPGEDGVGESPTPYTKLKRPPRKMEDFSITWKPRTSQGVTQDYFDGQAAAP